jgi:uncharacterized protein
MYKNYMNKIFLILITAGLVACGGNVHNSINPIEHAQEIAAFDLKRVNYLKGEDGWLNLAGLFWLNEGVNTFGSADDNELNFPENKIPPHAGFILLNQNEISIQAAEGVSFQINGKDTSKGIIYHPDSSRIIIAFGSLQWFVIKRDNKYGIRLRDFENPEIQNFQGIERFPVDVAWRIEAAFVKEQSEKYLPIVNILGKNAPMKILGTLHFKIADTKYSLIALDEGDGGDLFVIFTDDTNARETYGAGRYLYVAWPTDGDDKVIIDFNKSFNPPCAFTEFATCPLPPSENNISIAITAGEKNYGTH